MATSGSFNFANNTYTDAGYPNHAQINWSATWNDSTMLWSVSWTATAQGGSTAGRWVSVFSGSVTVTDGAGNTLQTASMSSRIDEAKNNTVLLSGSFTVGIDGNGNRNLNFSGSFQFETTAASGRTSGSQTFALDQILLASTISSVTSNVSVGDDGGTVSVSITRNSSNYTHTVVYTFGSYSTTHTNVGTSDSLTIPATWLNAIPNNPSGTARVTVTTMNGTSPVGEDYKDFTITANVYPTITGLTVAPYGNPSGVSGYVSGFTQATLTTSGVGGVYGSTIRNIAYIRNGSTIANTTDTSYTTGALSGTSASFSVIVTDSRGRTASEEASAITITPYSLPSFSNTSIYRSNSTGTASDSGTYIYIKTTASASGTGNTAALGYSIKAATDANYPADTSFSSNTAVIVGGKSTTTSYNVRLTATDKFGQPSFIYATVSTATFTMDFRVGGLGVAFGKVAEADNELQSAWAIKAPNLLEFH